MSSNRPNVLLTAFALVGLFTPVGVAAAYEIQPEFVMYHDPEFDIVADTKRLDERLLPLWREVLLRPEVDHQRQAAEAIAQAAESGYPGMEIAQEDLHELLTTAVDPAARCAAARALIAIDARSSADALYEASRQYDSQLRQIVEPALASWEYTPIRDVWRSRVRDPQTNRRELLLALQGLARCQDADVTDALLEIVHSGDRPSDVRLNAARAAGAGTDRGLEPQVDLLLQLSATRVLHKLCVVALLSRHDSETARNQLTNLARDVEPTVAEQALGRLFDIDPQLVIPLVDEARMNLDPKVRRRAADAYVALPTPGRVAILSELLNDVHPDVRGSIREDLFALAAQPELDDAVRESALVVLDGDIWRGQEQASLLLGALDHEPAAARMIELLNSDRSEVEISTGWGLRMLAVSETLPDLLAHAQRRTIDRREGRSTNGLDEQIAHLFELFAIMQYDPAEELLREYVPKPSPAIAMGYFSRGAAIWTLGHFHAGKPDQGLADQLLERLNDTADVFNSELDIAWQMSAISLGRMHAELPPSALHTRLMSSFMHDPVAYAIRWAILQITGEEIPTPPAIVRGMTGWFLEPLNDAPLPESGSEDALD